MSFVRYEGFCCLSRSLTSHFNFFQLDSNQVHILASIINSRYSYRRSSKLSVFSDSRYSYRRSPKFPMSPRQTRGAAAKAAALVASSENINENQQLSSPPSTPIPAEKKGMFSKYTSLPVSRLMADPSIKQMQMVERPHQVKIKLSYLSLKPLSLSRLQQHQLVLARNASGNL